MRKLFQRQLGGRTDAAWVDVEGGRVAFRRDEAERTVEKSWYLANEREARQRGAEVEAELLGDGYSPFEPLPIVEAAPPKPIEIVAKKRRATFVRHKILDWYEDNVAAMYEGVPEDEDPLTVVPGHFDAWDDGFYDDLCRAFGSASLDGSSDLLEATIGDIVELISKQWDGKFYGF